VYDVAAGAGFTVIAAICHKTPYTLFGCGLNTDSQIGYQESRPNAPLIAIENVVPIHLPIEASFNNKKGSSEITKPNEVVKKVAAGRAHTICLTSKGHGKFDYM